VSEADFFLQSPILSFSVPFFFPPFTMFERLQAAKAFSAAAPVPLGFSPDRDLFIAQFPVATPHDCPWSHLRF